ncbi:MAG: glutamine-hydrolyzing GMP synthase [Erysipelotrichaceae bacterium]|nr:glutamine-hydrolyzing GMP synthase [Erysipelotrichaceae bacterium]MBR3168277.1 glutamine-hydrolyzing GMP synthase [Erysipelotrichaceae bacterium]
MENAHEKILILDFGGQYTQLIARRVRELHVYSEIVPWNIPAETVRNDLPAGIILSGGPSSVKDEDAPFCDREIFELGVPVLGICYGMQLLASLLGGNVAKAEEREYGPVTVRRTALSKLLENIWSESVCWMSHTWQVTECPPSFRRTAESRNCRIAAMENEGKRLYGVQFHPEVTHTEEGETLLENFLFRICGCKADWTMEDYIGTAVRQIRQAAGETGRILLALSGGVDSAVAASLIREAVGDRLTCVFVDHGLLRKGESEQVCSVFSELFPVSFVRVDAAERFFRDLKGVSDPEQKRHIIGRDFIEVFREEAEKLGKFDAFAQGTIYPDVIESGQSTNASVIKSHHNVGGLPAELGFRELIEPLRMLFKDEVRALGETLGLPAELVRRQPFPGPGLAIRVIGEVTPEKVRIVRESDAVFREEIAKAGLQKDLSQYFTVLTDVKSVGVMGDERTYDYTVALRAVTTDDFMTADWAKLPYELITHVSGRIVSEVPGVNRVVLDVTPKPPASIEWE